MKIEKLKPIIAKFLKKKGIARAGIFGSYAKNKQNKKSDIGILIEFKGSLLDLVGIELELEKLLKKKIDLLTYNSINPLLKQKILSEEVKII